MNARDQAVVAVLVEHERWVAEYRAALPALWRNGTVDESDRAKFDGPTLEGLIASARMPRREARRALARLTESGMVVGGGRYGDQFRLASVDTISGLRQGYPELA